MRAPSNKGEMHPNNKHRGRYDFAQLTKAYPTLEQFLIEGRDNGTTINFFDDKAVRALNTALLIYHYDLEYWEIPATALTPAIPSRADYVHYLAELVGNKKSGTMRCLDIGVGANCIYPIIGSKEYDWNFVGSDTELESISNAQKIIDNNPRLSSKVELRHQANSKAIFEGIVKPDEYFDMCMCNPPFHSSAKSAMEGSQRKLRNLKGGKNAKATLNFAGKANELWCEGGERGFITKMIDESTRLRTNFRWFTSLVSNEDNLPALERRLTKARVFEHRIINMYQGNKRSRILAWRY